MNIKYRHKFYPTKRYSEGHQFNLCLVWCGALQVPRQAPMNEGNVCLSLQDKSNYFNMKMEAADTPEQFVPIYQNSWRQITGHRDWKWYVQDDAKSKFILELRIHIYLLMGRVLSANLPTLSFTNMKYRYCNLVCSNGGIILRGENRWT